MFAIVDIAGFQEKVAQGDVLRVPLLDAEKGKKVTFSDVLLIDNGGDVQVGTPFVAGASVEATIGASGKDKKIRVLKMKRRKRYRRVHGHRQDYTDIEITKIAAGKKAPAKKVEPKEEAAEE